MSELDFFFVFLVRQREREREKGAGFPPPRLLAAGEQPWPWSSLAAWRPSPGDVAAQEEEQAEREKRAATEKRKKGTRGLARSAPLSLSLSPCFCDSEPSARPFPLVSVPSLATPMMSSVTLEQTRQGSFCVGETTGERGCIASARNRKGRTAAAGGRFGFFQRDDESVLHSGVSRGDKGDTTGIVAAFPTPGRFTMKILKPFIAREGGIRHEMKAEFGVRAEAPSLWQLASNLAQYKVHLFSLLLSPRKRTTARHASTQIAKEARARDISCERRQREREVQVEVRREKKFFFFVFLPLPLFFVTRRFFSTLVDHRGRERERQREKKALWPLFSESKINPSILGERDNTKIREK